MDAPDETPDTRDRTLTSLKYDVDRSNHSDYTLAHHHQGREGADLKFERLLMVYDLLPVHPRKLGVAELHKMLAARDVEFNVSLRTLQRDLQDLSCCYLLDVFSDGQPQAGWSKRPRFAALDGVAGRDAANDAHYLPAHRLAG